MNAIFDVDYATTNIIVIKVQLLNLSIPIKGLKAGLSGPRK